MKFPAYFCVAWNMISMNKHLEIAGKHKEEAIMMIKDDTSLALGHKLTLEGRSKLSITGVTDAESFDETVAVLETARGTLIVRGGKLHVEQLNLEAGEVRITGEVDSLTYEESRQTQGSFFERLFR